MKIGKFYWVPCVKTGRKYRLIAGTLIPILGPRHEDQDIIMFQYHHWHVDWRFVGQRGWERSIFAHCSPHSIVVCDFHIEGQPELKWLKCKRLMPEFPTTPWTPELEEKYKDQTLKPGLMCPHRGMPLAGCPVKDGVVICPGHGLAWNIESGKMQTRQNENRPDS